MANRLMSAYGNLAQAKTNIGSNLSDIAGIGIDMEYGAKGRIASQMAQRNIATQTAAIGLGLEAVQKIAGLGKQASEEASRAREMGEFAGTGSEQTVGETRLWDLIRGKAEIGEGETWLGEASERIGTGLGLIDREYNIGGKRYTSSQLEAGAPWAKLNRDWEEVSGLMGGGSSIQTSNDSKYKDPELKKRITKKGGPKLGAYWEGGVEERDADGNVISTLYEAASSGDTTTYGNPLTANDSKYTDITFSQYLKDPSRDQSLINQLMSGGWASATQQWKEARKTL